MAAVLSQAADLPDPLPPELLTKYRMPDKAAAVRAIHAPHSVGEANAARRRLIFEELYVLQLGIFLLRSHGRRAVGAPMHPLDLGPFWRSLPFAPTGAQRRAAEEIAGDLCGKTPMNRLLQGDVGSGQNAGGGRGYLVCGPKTAGRAPCWLRPKFWPASTRPRWPTGSSPSGSTSRCSSAA